MLLVFRYLLDGCLKALLGFSIMDFETNEY